jgi:hypothetical protein
MNKEKRLRWRVSFTCQNFFILTDLHMSGEPVLCGSTDIIPVQISLQVGTFLASESKTNLICQKLACKIPYCLTK